MSLKPSHSELEHQIKLLEQQRDTYKQIATKLKKSEVKYRAILENIEDSFLEVDLKGNFIYFNNSFCRLLGYDREELTGRNNQEFLDADNARKVQEILAGVYTTKKSAIGATWEIIRKDGARRCVESSVSLITNVAGKIIGFRGIGRDVTDKRQSEENLRRINHELKQAIEQARTMAENAERANAAKSEFLAKMSHEIRTPMNGIIGMTDLVLDTHLTAEQREYLEMAMMSANSLLGLINDILDFSKAEAGQLELEFIEFNLRITLEHAVATLAPKAHEKGLELACHMAPDVPTALIGDPGRLRQVIVHLAENAIKFTESGEVVIRVERKSETGTSVTLHVMVTDTGIGIPQAKLGSIFQGFEQVDGSTTRKYGGTGLGLSISKQLVELMGGEIRAESPKPYRTDGTFPAQRRGPDKGQPGSMVHFTAKFQMNQVLQVGPLRLNPQDLSGMPILIVDDNATNRILLQEMLTAWGFAPTSASHAQEALSLAARAFQKQSPFLLALFDVQMPEIDGFTLAEMMREAPFGEKLKMIMISSIGLKGDSRRCREVGISGYLSKPVKQSELLETILVTMGQQEEEEAVIITRHSVCDLRDRLHILLVEDNLINQTLAIKLLKTRGHQVTLAGNGREAVEAFKQTEFDLILMDIQMPEMDGFEATHAIRELAKENTSIPIIAMTAHSLTSDQEKCLEAGMDAYVPKPIKPDALFKVIDSVIGGTRKKKTTQALPTAPGKAFAPKSFDLSRAMETVLNDEEIFREIARVFIGELPDNLAKIRQGVLEKDAHTLERAAHSLKGAVGNFGADAAYETAQRLETLGKQNKLDMAAEEYTKLEELLSDLAHDIKLVLEGMNHEDSDR